MQISAKYQVITKSKEVELFFDILLSQCTYFMSFCLCISLLSQSRTFGELRFKSSNRNQNILKNVPLLFLSLQLCTKNPIFSDMMKNCLTQKTLVKMRYK